MAELVGSVLGNWESLLPPDVVRQIHGGVPGQSAEGEHEIEGEAEAGPVSGAVPAGTTPRSERPNARSSDSVIPSTTQRPTG